jgi:aarF domain-containing kinase
MTDVTPEQSIALVEYIAHLSAKDWEAVTRDLVTLGFIPPGGSYSPEDLPTGV